MFLKISLKNAFFAIEKQKSGFELTITAKIRKDERVRVVLDCHSLIFPYIKVDLFALLMPPALSLLE